jgi:hypothetical protein
LRGELENRAVNDNFTVPYKGFADGSQPDVLCTSADGNSVFIGDAKDAENETAHKSETLRRIANYFHNAVKLVTDGKAVVFVIATNDKDAAAQWANTLYVLSVRYNVPTPFISQKISDNPWVVHPQ